MNRIVGTTIAIIAFAAMLAAAADARDHNLLAPAAAKLGYHYAYLGPEDAVSLSRPGVVVLVRPGERLFDVNDRTEAMDIAPRFESSDLVVSDAFVARLRQLAAIGQAQAGNDHAFATRNAATRPEPADRTGSISGLAAHQIDGTQDIFVSGKAPAYLPITLTLVGTFSTEVPDVVINRSQVSSDATGAFSADVPIAPAFYRGARLTVIASSSPGISIAKTRLEAKAPNRDTPITADEEPKSIR
jgi:hypothetical protein